MFEIRELFLSLLSMLLLISGYFTAVIACRSLSLETGEKIQKHICV